MPRRPFSRLLLALGVLAALAVLVLLLIDAGGGADDGGPLSVPATDAPPAAAPRLRAAPPARRATPPVAPSDAGPDAAEAALAAEVDRSAWIEGRVVDVEGGGVMAVRVTAADAASGGTRTEAWTRSSGAFTLLVEGHEDPLVLEAAPPAARRRDLQPARREGVAPGTKGVVLVLAPGALVSGTLSLPSEPAGPGRLYHGGPWGNVRPGAARPHGVFAWQEGGPRRPLAVVGRTFSGVLAPGRWFLQADLEHHAPSPVVEVVAPASGVVLALEPGRRLMVRLLHDSVHVLPRDQRVEATWRDAAGAHVRVMDGMTLRGLPQETVTLVARWQGPDGAGYAVREVPPGLESIVLDTEEGDRVTGHVEGTPVAGQSVWIELRDEAYGFADVVLAAAGEAFEVKGLWPGRYRLRACARGLDASGPPRSGPWVETEAGAHGVLLRLPAGAASRGDLGR